MTGDKRLHVQRWGTGYAVMEGTRRLTGVIGLLALAEFRMDQIERRRQHRARPCLCCGKTFTSEGPHNRMCNPCREHASNVAA